MSAPGGNQVDGLPPASSFISLSSSFRARPNLSFEPGCVFAKSCENDEIFSNF